MANNDVLLTVPVGVSGRHIHLSLEHVEQLFGVGLVVTPINELALPWQFGAD